MALIGGQGVGLVLSLWSAARVEKLSQILSQLNDSTSSKVSKKLSELADAKKTYAAVKGSLASDVNESMAPALKADFDALTKNHRHLSNLIRRSEILIETANTRIENLKGLNPLNFDEQLKVIGERNRALALKVRSEKKLALLKVLINETENKLTQLLKQNQKIYPTYRRYILSKNLLQQVVLSLDTKFSKMLQISLLKLLKLHTSKTTLRFSKKVTTKNITLNNARVTYITTSGFIFASIGYTLWTTLSDAESDAERLVLEVKEVLENEDSGETTNEINEE